MLSSFAVATESLLEIDHCFICLPAPVAASALVELGLNCLPQAISRPQQGTVSRPIFFENMYLELIWVEDIQAARRHARQSKIDFLARAQQQASPFGIALRQTLNRADRPFDLLPDQTTDREIAGASINFAADNLRSPAEPLCFVIPDPLSLLSLLDRTSIFHRQMVSHPAGMRRLTKTRITAPTSASRFSRSVSLLRQDGIAELATGASLLELSFDNRQQQQTLDLRQLEIPVVLHY